MKTLNTELVSLIEKLISLHIIYYHHIIPNILYDEYRIRGEP